MKEQKKLPLFYKAIEYFDKSDNQETLIAKKSQSEYRRSNTALLRDEMLNELNNLRNIINNNPDLKVKSLSKKEKEKFSKFIKFYQICPICYQYNHYRNLKQIYFDENKILKDKLVRIMDLKKKYNKTNIRFGIPCCNCYKKLEGD